MKANVRMILFLLVCLVVLPALLSGCGKAGSPPVGFEIVPGTVTPTGLTYRITRKAESWEFGEGFSVDRQENGEWVPVPPVESEIEFVFTAIGYELTIPGASKDMTAGWSMLYGELEPGHYRIAKRFHHKVSAAREEITLYAEFDIPAA